MKARLERLRAGMLLTWKELQNRLEISESTLYFLRSGARKPSPKLLRKIVAMEVEAGLTKPPDTLAVRETQPGYKATKQLNIVDLKHLISDMEKQLAALKALLEGKS
jgi:prophage antirepressor-like protein